MDTGPHPSRTVLISAVALAVTATLSVGVTTAAQGAAHHSVAARASHHSVNLRFASFNLQSVGLDRTHGQQRPWKQRRGTIISEIRGERVDVIGVQEANPAKSFAPRLVGGANQYLDLRNGLNRAGGHFALTNVNAVDCVNGTSAYKCRHRDRGASFSERILYNTHTIRMISRNSMKYRAQGHGRANLYLTWAVFRSKVNGRSFLFTSTHLDAAHRSVRAAQWRQMMSKIKHIKHGRPVIAVGDFNTTKFDKLSRSMLPAMKHAGFGDVLNQQYKVNPSRHVRAKKRINGWLGTFNFLNRNVRRFGATRSHDRTGNGIDYIFATNSLKVKEYKVVLRFNRRTLKVEGVLPSDHNLIRATIALPAP